MRMTLKALAALLGYPSEELKHHAQEISDVLREEGALRKPALAKLQPLLGNLASDDLLDLQITYSDLFDRSRRLSLHLFEHIHGDGRERGQAMIDLGEQYAQSGFLLDTRELPDFVPVFLEYASSLSPREARAFLAQPAHVFAAMAERLDERDAPYAGIFHALLALAGVKPDAEALSELKERQPSDDPAKIDEEWAEAPVTFLASAAHDMGGPTGVVAKIRASNRAVSKDAGHRETGA
ncbi:nitrate reductase molybdenum cofactor assembly chaperone [Sphingomonas sp.]|uniref:nitrate reductase molybdenum cofactor assembly chaperone n=1 Tax=Sphingomonas sp. TaxID=28214 RepID=UPI0026345FD1|nr:nitrate reductase molybdenum cofactor assembly chaperone [Sphingomonas sp.]MDF2495430.1 nitrate reductase molybdenum cofactor assembly chaperone [Sphingomonas sp.]